MEAKFNNAHSFTEGADIEENQKLDKTKVFIDLSKLSEGKQNKIEKVTGHSVAANDYPYLIWLNGRWDQGVRYHIKNRQELSYTQFLEMILRESNELKLSPEVIKAIAISHQKQMSSVHSHAIIGTIEDAIIEALEMIKSNN